MRVIGIGFFKLVQRVGKPPESASSCGFCGIIDKVLNDLEMSSLKHG